MTKKIISLMTALLVSGVLILSLCINASAANVTLRLVMGLGRNSVIYQNGNTTEIQSLQKSTDDKSKVYSPLSMNNKTLVPIRYIFEKVGFSVDYDGAAGAIVLTTKTKGNFPVWVSDDVNGAKKIQCTKAELKDNLFTLYEKDKIVGKIKISGTENLNGSTYIPVRELEPFEFIIKWDSAHSIVQIYSGGNNQDFAKAFEAIIKEDDSARKDLRIADFFADIPKDDKFDSCYEKYISNGSQYNNSTNNSLAVKFNNTTYIGNFSGKSNEEIKETIVEKNSRQLCYAVNNNRNYIYHVNTTDKKLYVTEINANGKVSAGRKVELPQDVAAMKVSQVVTSGDRVFFVAYNDPNEGGYIYMANIGYEKDTIIKLTSDKVWNIAITGDYEVCYVNFSDNCKLYAINLKEFEVMNNCLNNRTTGIRGRVINDAAIQSIAYTGKIDDYYFVDINDGAVKHTYSKNGELVTEVLVQTENSKELFNFLNLYTNNGEAILYYMTYTNGKAGNYNECKIASYDVHTGEKKIVYMSNEMIMQLTILDDSIYFATENYARLSKLTITDAGYSVVNL